MKSQEDKDKKISQEFENEINIAAKNLLVHSDDMAQISNDGLMGVAKKREDEIDETDTDEQTRLFCKFISISTNFASEKFITRVQRIPVLVNTIKSLVEEIKKEIKEYAEMANFLNELILSFINIVNDTKHKMNMMSPYLKNIVALMDILKEVSEIDEPLKDQDLKDTDSAITRISDGGIIQLK